MEAEKRSRGKNPGQIQVLHLIDGLSGGGCERWIWDIVRLSDPRQFVHLVVTIFLDDGTFVYAAPLRARQAYRQPWRLRALCRLRPAIEWLDRWHRLIPLRKSLSALWYAMCWTSALGHIGYALLRFRPDIVHVHTFEGFRIGLLLKRLSRLPLVHTVPCLVAQMEDAGYGWMTGLYRRYHPCVDCFITGASIHELREVGVPPSKIKGITGAVDLRAVDSASADRARHRRAIRQELGVAEGDFMALSVGRLHPSKGHRFALDALPTVLVKCPTLHWVVLGQGAEWVPLERRASELGVSKNVHLAGFRPEPLPFYAAADVYLRTPVFEAENLSSYQAMAMGLPVIGFDTGCETELINKVGHGMLVPIGDARALAQAMIDLVGMDSKHREEMGARGSQYCRQHLDLHTAIRSFEGLYARIVEGEASRDGRS